MFSTGGSFPVTVLPVMGFGRGIVGNPAGSAFGCPLMLTARVVGIGGFAVGMGTGFGVVTAGAIVTGESMIFPAAGDLFSAVSAICHIAVHIAVLVRIGGFRFAVLAVAAGGTFAGTIVGMVFPSGIAPAFRDRTAFAAPGFVAVHLLVFYGVHFFVVVRTRRRDSQRKQAHHHHHRENHAQDSGTFSFHKLSFHRSCKRKTPHDL